MTLPDWLSAVLPENTAKVWEEIAPLVPGSCYLAGGTGVAVHIQHRESRDLDFFFHRSSVDLDSLQATLFDTGSFAVEKRAPGTLNGFFEKTKVQFLHADEARPQRLLIPKQEVVSGLCIAALPDLLAMKLKAIADRGEHRDYFDLQKIEEMTPYTVDEGINYFIARFQPQDVENAVFAIINALGYMDDIDEDEAIPLKKAEVERYWKRRQPEILKNAGWLTSGGTPPPPSASL